MKNSLFFGVATRSMKANRNLEVPFVLASSVMGMLFYIMLNLVGNSYVQTRHASLPVMMRFGVVFCGILTTVFVFYANRFLMKNRNRELALYSILGLEKRHVARVLGIENTIRYILVVALSITGGQLLGLLAFLWLNRLMGDMSVGMGEYGFDPANGVSTALFFLLLFGSVYMSNLFRVRISSPMELMSTGSRSEGEPKNNYFSLLSGLLLAGAGYYIALTTKGTLDSLMLFFIAVILVIGGTYQLFKSLSIFVLKSIKRNRNSFYRPVNFISVSGMLYRMRANAMGLASVCVLLTGIMIAGASGLTIYRGIEALVGGSMKNEYAIEGQKIRSSSSEAEVEEELSRLSAIVQKTESSEDKIGRIDTSVQFFAAVIQKGSQILPMTPENQKDMSLTSGTFLEVQTVSDYNRIHQTALTLGPDEVYMTSNSEEMQKHSSLELVETKYTVKPLDDKVSSRIAVEMYLILVPDYETLQRFGDYYVMIRPGEEKAADSEFSLSIGWDMAQSSEDYAKSAESILRAEGIEGQIQSKEKIRSFIYELNGSFVFLGLLISLMLLTGTTLITYYKQITEGHEDRGNIQIMKKVGLPDDLIKKTSNRQVVWLFALPLLVALLHTVVASKILFRMLGLFGIRDWSFYLVSLGMILVSIVIVYLFVYRLTSKEYYRIVTES